MSWRLSQKKLKCLPQFTTLIRICKQIVRWKSFIHHPRFIVPSLKTIQFVVQLRVPKHLSSLFFLGSIWLVFRRTREMYRPRERRMRIFTILQTIGGTTKMGITALFGGAVNFKFLRWVRFTFTMTRSFFGEPRAVPTRRAPSKRVIIYSVWTW